MPTLLTAGDATNGVVLTSSNDNALTIQTGAAGAKVNAAAFASDGTLTLVKPMAGGSLTLGTAQNTTSGTSIDFTGIPSWANRITVMLNQISTNGTSAPQIQVGSGSFVTSGYLSAAVGAVVGSLPSGNVFSSGFVLNGATSAAASIHQGRLTLIRLSGNTWTAQGSFSVTSGTVLMYVIDGTVTLSGALDRIRLTTVGGTDTFDAGSVNILYEG